MDKKYELFKEDSIEFNGRTLFRIKALKDFQTIHGLTINIGDLGGYIQSEKNLSQEGNCWVSGKAMVMENARVKDNARVSFYARVCDNAILQDNAKALHHSIICDKAIVKDNAIVSSNSVIKGNAVISNFAQVKYGSVCGNAKVCDNAVISTYNYVSGNAYINGDIVINHSCRIASEETIIYNNETPIVLSSTDVCCCNKIDDIWVTFFRVENSTHYCIPKGVSILNDETMEKIKKVQMKINNDIY